MAAIAPVCGFVGIGAGVAVGEIIRNQFGIKPSDNKVVAIVREVFKGLLLAGAGAVIIFSAITFGNALLAGGTVALISACALTLLKVAALAALAQVIGNRGIQSLENKVAGFSRELFKALLFAGAGAVGVVYAGITIAAAFYGSLSAFIKASVVLGSAAGVLIGLEVFVDQKGYQSKQA